MGRKRFSWALGIALTVLLGCHEASGLRDPDQGPHLVDSPSPPLVDLPVDAPVDPPPPPLFLRVAAPNPIPAENARPGDATWRSGSNPGPGVIDLYTSRESAKAGDRVAVKVSTKLPERLQATVYRLGHYGGAGARKVWTGSDFAPVTQAPCPREASTGLVECQWADTFAFTVGEDWVAGLYMVKVTQGRYKRFAPFVVRDNRAAELLFAAGFNTYQAYNTWGGESLYQSSSVERLRAYKVSYDRPYDAGEGSGKLFYLEYPFVSWLEKEGYDVTYGTNQDFLRHANFLQGISVFVHAGHDEYWPTEQRAQVDAALASGRMSLAYFGGNGAYWRVRGEPSSTGEPLRTVVCYKNRPDLDPQPGTTVRFRDDPNAQPESALFGVMYDGWQLLSFPLVVADERHWLFEGTGLTTGTQLPGLLGYEADRIFPELASTPSDQRVSLESPYLTAEGLPNISHAVDRELPGGTLVFAAGSIQWPLALSSDPELRDDRVNRMTANVLERALAHRRAPRTLAPVSGSGQPQSNPDAVWAGTVSAFAGEAGPGGYRDGPGAQARFNGPTGIAATADGKVFVADTNNNRIRLIDNDPERTVSTVAGTGTLGPARVTTVSGAVAQFRRPTGLAVGPDGAVYVADSDNHCIRRITWVNGAWEVSLFAGSDARQQGHVNGAATDARFRRPTALTFDAAGNLFVADQAGNRIRRIDALTREVSTVAGNGSPGHADALVGTDAMLNNPSAIGVADTGEIYVLDAGNQKLKRISADAARTVVTLAGKPNAPQGYADGRGNEARFRAQMGLAMGPEGEVYLADTANFRLRKVLPGADAETTRVYTIAGSGKLGTRLGNGEVADLSLPSGLARMPGDGSLLVVDGFNNIVRRIVR